MFHQQLTRYNADSARPGKPNSVLLYWEYWLRCFRFTPRVLISCRKHVVCLYCAKALLNPKIQCRMCIDSVLYRAISSYLRPQPNTLGALRDCVWNMVVCSIECFWLCSFDALPLWVCSSSGSHLWGVCVISCRTWGMSRAALTVTHHQYFDCKKLQFVRSFLVALSCEEV